MPTLPIQILQEGAALASLGVFVWAIMVWAPVVHQVYASVAP